ncbi:hypothetical protein HRbin28_02587 [bacterium HR28]|jgi:hypothetical protein|uniref:Uncharacterized protein n=1 Tax=Thermomicrobium roseum TaxID=500 RepID=A0A7C1FSD9_THERO|nr:hypothetical protein HRbin28_02587 [bacterium HR28]
MQKRSFQLVGRRSGQPHVLLFRDQEGRYYLRPGCNGRLVRLTARDAQRLFHNYQYRPVLTTVWLSYEEVIRVDCPLPLDQ